MKLVTQDDDGQVATSFFHRKLLYPVLILVSLVKAILLIVYISSVRKLT